MYIKGEDSGNKKLLYSSLTSPASPCLQRQQWKQAHKKKQFKAIIFFYTLLNSCYTDEIPKHSMGPIAKQRARTQRSAMVSTFEAMVSIFFDHTKVWWTSTEFLKTTQYKRTTKDLFWRRWQGNASQEKDQNLGSCGNHCGKARVHTENSDPYPY